MITREEALANADSVGSRILINQIYKELGTCKTCKFSEPMRANRWCNRYKHSKEHSWFCADFEPLTEKC